MKSILNVPHCLARTQGDIIIVYHSGMLYGKLKEDFEEIRDRGKHPISPIMNLGKRYNQDYMHNKIIRKVLLMSLYFISVEFN